MSVINVLTFILKIALILAFVILLIFLNIIFLLQPEVFRVVYPFLTETDQISLSSMNQLENGSMIEEELNSGSSFTNSSVKLSDLERNHMRDVSYIVQIIKLITAVVISFFALGALNLYRKKFLNWKRLLHFFQQSVLCYAAILSTFGISVYFFWPQFFTLIHLMLFPQGNWTFPPESTLIRLFPDIFWQRTLVLLSVSTLAELSGMLTIVRFMSKMKKQQ